jgi:hypothetical protein
MRNVALAAVVALALVPGQAAAQQAGVKAGVTVSNLSFNPDYGARSAAERKTGVTGGIFVVAPVHQRLALQLEALVSQQGAREVFRFGDAVKLTYLDVPVLARIRAFSAAGGSAYVFSGPTVGIRLSAKYDDDGEVEDISDDIDRFNVGWTAGLGAEVGRVVMDVRYTWGLTTLITEGDTGSKLRTGSLAAMVGLRWGRAK